MRVDLKWNEQMSFTATAADRVAQVDAPPPLGKGSAMAPKELLLSALASCTAMDVVALLRKHKQDLEHFGLRVEGALSEGAHPKVFTSAKLSFEIAGKVDPAIALEAVHASQSKYCGVSAMLSKAFPISYDVVVNGVPAGSGESFTDDSTA